MDERDLTTAPWIWSNRKTRGLSLRRCRRASLIALLASSAVPLSAQQALADQETDEIIVFGDRLRGVTAERTYDQDTIATYGVSTVEDLIGEIRAEIGDDEGDPAFFLNGEQVTDLDDVAGFPVEAIQRLDVIARGTATRLGTSQNRRAYNIVLRKNFKSGVVTVAPRFATEGNWGAMRAETNLTKISGQNRINLSLRVRDEGKLLESDRGIIQLIPRRPYDLRGNVIADPRLPGEEIDPFLSALAGVPVTVAPIPAGSTLKLNAFVEAANSARRTEQGEFRTLRPSTRSYDMGLTIGRRLAPWLTSTFTARLNASDRQSLLGLRSGVFILPAANPASPFSRDVGIAVYGDEDALQQNARRRSANAGVSLNASLGTWRAHLNANHQRGNDYTRTDRQISQSAGAILLSDDINPFSSSFGEMLPIRTDLIRSLSSSSNLRASVTRPLWELPAGAVSATVEARLSHFGLRSRSNLEGLARARGFGRTERALRGTLELPIASRLNDVLSAAGELTANLEYSLIRVSGVGTLKSFGFGGIWTPVEWIRINGSVNDSRRPPSIQALQDPLLVTAPFRIFDFLVGETVDVTLLSGGNSLLLPENVRTQRLSANIRPLGSKFLQLSAEYLNTSSRNLVSSLPPASAAVLLAFPERYIRDASGTLTSIDIRPVNFSRQAEERLRYGFNLNLPLGGSMPPRQPSGGNSASQDESTTEEGSNEQASVPPAASGSKPGPQLQLTVNHTLVLNNEILIRPDLPPVDLLRGGAIGIGGGRPRHQLDFSAGVTVAGLGGRVTGLWRGQNELQTRTAGSATVLQFAPLATLNLKLFAEASRLLPEMEWAKGTRLSLSIINLTGGRQRVTDATGSMPLQFQPAYRDSLGRTLELEIRKAF